MSAKPTTGKASKAFYAQGGVVPPELSKLYEMVKKLDVDPNDTSSPPKQMMVQPQQLIKPYYGDQFANEAMKAKKYLETRFPVSSYDTIFKADRTVSGDRSGIDVYGQGYGEFLEGLFKKIPVQSSEIENGKTEATFTPFYRSDGVHLQDTNYQRLEDKYGNSKFGREFQGDQQKRGLSALEHEIGHSIPLSVNVDKPNLLETDSNWEAMHVGKPDEFVEGLARLQRETFLTTGKRIETGAELFDLIKSLPEHKAPNVQGRYSPDVMRTLEVLRQSFKGKLGNKKHLHAAGRILPALVQQGTKKNLA